jgi:hypothetical protein
MTMTMNGNGQVGRKNLASQLDRLDSILDVLSDGLNEAVATVVQEAVGKAVELAVKEVLCNPDVLRAMRAQAAPEPKRSAPAAHTDFLRRAWNFGRSTMGGWAGGAARGLGRACAWIAGKWKRLAGSCGAAWNTLGALLPLAWQARTQVAVAGVIGTAVAVGCWWSGPAVAATVCGLAGFVGSLFASALKVLRRAPTANVA